jgi:hypothetical protein
MCGSNPLQFHLSQSSDLRYNTLSKLFPYTIHTRKFRVQESLNIEHSQDCKT